MNRLKIDKLKLMVTRIIIFIIIMILTGSAWQGIMIKKETNEILPQGQVFNINKHNINIYATGSGRNTVVLVTGSGTPSSFTDFYKIQMKLKPYARIVSFDKAGFGWSEETNIPRTIDTLSEELHELLEKSGQPSPYILVGHSLASLEVINFAQKYPSKVKGIILLDGGSPEFYAEYSEVKAIMLNRFCAGVRVTGIARMFGNMGINLPFVGENLRYDQLPDEIKKIDIDMYYKYLGNTNNLEFIESMNENASEVMKKGYLKDIPLIIISSQNGDEWEKVQQQLLNWSNYSSQETLSDSNHYIHWTNTDYVVNKIKEMLEITS